jgi:hypothetical protein
MGRKVITVLSCAFITVVVCALAAGTVRPAAAADQWGSADLRVTISTAPKVAQPGQPITYLVKVRNRGPGDAVLPVLRVRMPRDLRIVHVDVAKCGLAKNGRVVVCPSSVDVPAGTTGSVRITGLVRPAARGPLRARATLTSEVVDPNEADNVAEAVTKVGPGADLAVRFGPAVGQVRPGHRFAVRAEVRNRGPRTVRDAFLFLRQQQARLVSASGARCRRWRSFAWCTLPPLRPGRTGLVHLVFRVPPHAVQPVRATAVVFSGRLGDRSPANNRARMRLALHSA